MKDFASHSQRFAERGRPDRHDHELLHVDGGIGMRTSVEYVHHGDGQDLGVGPTQVLVQRQTACGCGGVGSGHGGSQDGVGSQNRLVGCPVQVKHGLVHCGLIGGIKTDQSLGYLSVHVFHSLGNTLAQIAVLVAVPQFYGFMLARACSRRHCGAPESSSAQFDFHFNRWVAS